MEALDEPSVTASNGPVLFFNLFTADIVLAKDTAVAMIVLVLG